MKKRRKKPKKSHNRKLHQNAVQNPETKKLLDKTREEWPRLGLVVRGDRVCELLQHGCTMRGLADEFSCSPGYIHWLKKIAELPVAERQEVEAGANPKRYVDRARCSRRTAEYQARIKGNQALEREVNRIEGAIHEFISKEKCINTSVEADQLLNETRLIVGDQERLHRARPQVFPIPAPAPTGARPERIIATTRPAFEPWDDKDVHPMAIASEQLAIALLRIPDEKVRWKAVGRAQAKYQRPFWIGTGPGKTETGQAQLTFGSGAV